MSKDLDSRSRELYNVCVGTRQDVVSEVVVPLRKKLLLQSRHFAFLLMALAHLPGTNGRELRFDAVVRLFSVGFKVARLALGASVIRGPS